MKGGERGEVRERDLRPVCIGSRHYAWIIWVLLQLRGGKIGIDKLRRVVNNNMWAFWSIRGVVACTRHAIG